MIVDSTKGHLGKKVICVETGGSKYTGLKYWSYGWLGEDEKRVKSSEKEKGKMRCFISWTAFQIINRLWRGVNNLLQGQIVALDEEQGALVKIASNEDFTAKNDT